MNIRRKRAADDVRIGPISVLALISILSMAVLAVLAISTAHASLVISQKQASTVSGSYLSEAAAQDFVAEMDARLVDVRGMGAVAGSGPAAIRALQTSLGSCIDHAQEAVDNRVKVSAAVQGQQVTADFECVNARTLSIAVTVRDDGTLRIDEWLVAAVQNEEQPGGTLWAGN